MKYEIKFRHNEYKIDSTFVGSMEQWDEYVKTWGGTYEIKSKTPVEG